MQILNRGLRSIRAFFYGKSNSPASIQDTVNQASQKSVPVFKPYRVLKARQRPFVNQKHPVRLEVVGHSKWTEDPANHFWQLEISKRKWPKFQPSHVGPTHIDSIMTDVSGDPVYDDVVTPEFVDDPMDIDNFDDPPVAEEKDYDEEEDDDDDDENDDEEDDDDDPDDGVLRNEVCFNCGLQEENHESMSILAFDFALLNLGEDAPLPVKPSTTSDSAVKPSPLTINNKPAAPTPQCSAPSSDSSASMLPTSASEVKKHDTLPLTIPAEITQMSFPKSKIEAIPRLAPATAPSMPSVSRFARPTSLPTLAASRFAQQTPPSMPAAPRPTPVAPRPVPAAFLPIPATSGFVPTSPLPVQTSSASTSMLPTLNQEVNMQEVEPSTMPGKVQQATLPEDTEVEAASRLLQSSGAVTPLPRTSNQEVRRQAAPPSATPTMVPQVQLPNDMEIEAIPPPIQISSPSSSLSQTSNQEVQMNDTSSAPTGNIQQATLPHPTPSLLATSNQDVNMKNSATSAPAGYFQQANLSQQMDVGAPAPLSLPVLTASYHPGPSPLRRRRRSTSRSPSPPRLRRTPPCRPPPPPPQAALPSAPVLVQAQPSSLLSVSSSAAISQQQALPTAPVVDTSLPEKIEKPIFRVTTNDSGKRIGMVVMPNTAEEVVKDISKLWLCGVNAAVKPDTIPQKTLTKAGKQRAKSQFKGLPEVDFNVFETLVGMQLQSGRNPRELMPPEEAKKHGQDWAIDYHRVDRMANTSGFDPANGGFYSPDKLVGHQTLGTPRDLYDSMAEKISKGEQWVFDEVVHDWINETRGPRNTNLARFFAIVHRSGWVKFGKTNPKWGPIRALKNQRDLDAKAAELNKRLEEVPRLTLFMWNKLA
ncbi:hypothetical protein UCRPC4_g06175 [Phaeomoniella chlamydospora]|uniref:Uncharacterized protein n=1 Tax=Phaeomoniella chlamydospora TaxID=158046 RepID=A0A0G2DYT8_PHACM|nr:hypothetical protein UCRPC4_g06175 [Phaeomoniella chlamydospora]